MTPPNAPHSTRAERPQASTLFRVLAEAPEDGLLLTDDRSLGFGFQCLPLSGLGTGLFDRLNVFLNQEWPEDTLIQCLLFTSPDLGLRQSADAPSPKAHPFSVHLEGESQRFRQRATTHPLEELEGVLLRRSEVLLLVKLPLKGPEPQPSEYAQAQKLQSSAHQALQTIGLSPSVLDGQAWLRFMTVLLHGSCDADWQVEGFRRPSTDRPLRDQILDYDQAIEVGPDHIQLGPKSVKVLSVKRYPEAMSLGGAARYLGDLLTGSRGIRQNVLIGMILHYPEAETHRSKLSTSRQWITTQATGPMARFLPRLQSRKQQFDLLFEAFDEGDRPVRVALALALLTEPSEMTRALSNARVYFRELGFQIQEERFITLPWLLNLLPFGAERRFVQESQRFRTLATRQAIPMLPLFADWGGSGGSMLSLISRSGEAMRFSLFDSPTNYNASIAAQSGSGKSFLTNELIVRSLAQGARVWVIDIGRSYQNLCEHLGGEFMAFGQGSTISLNPFDLMKDWEEDADLIAGVFAAMAAPTSTLSDFQMAGFKRILRALQAKSPTTVTIDAVAQALLAESDSRIRDLGTQLHPFRTEGEYGRYFQQGQTIRFQNALTVLELEELKGRKHLQKVVLLLLILQIQKAMVESPRDQPKLVIIDESWELLTEGDAAGFIESGYRRFRKYGGSAITLTQSVNDLYRSSAGRAIVENSAHLLLLGQKGEAVELLRKEDRLALGDAGYALLKSVHTVPGAYSEIFIHGETGSGIGRLVVDPFKRLLFSTRPADIAAIARLKARGQSLEEAIAQILQERGGARP